MEHFKSTNQYQDILRECKLSNIMRKKAYFQCFVDGIMEYELLDGNVKHVFNLWCDTENWLKDMEVEWLLDMKRVEYFEHAIFMKDSNGDWKLEDSREFRYLPQQELN